MLRVLALCTFANDVGATEVEVPMMQEGEEEKVNSGEDNPQWMYKVNETTTAAGMLELLGFVAVVKS